MKQKEADLTTSDFIQTIEHWAFTSSWTHQLCVHGDRWSSCAGHEHADCKGIKELVSQREPPPHSLNKLVLPPEVPESTVGPDLLQPLQIFSQLVVQTVRQNLKQNKDFNYQTGQKR